MALFLPKPYDVGGDDIIAPGVPGDTMRELGPHRICRSGRHCLALTGVTVDGRCLACRRASHRRAQAKYAGTAKGLVTEVQHNANKRGNR